MIVAELSANHLGSIERAFKIIEAARRAGADAVKLQTYHAGELTIDHDGPGFVVNKDPWRGKKLFDLYAAAETPWDWFPRLFAYARTLGLVCFSSPFSTSAVAHLERFDCPIYKVASFEIIDLPLLECIARTRKPVIVSTGMASDKEIAAALAVLRGCKVTLLHCISEYPVRFEQANMPRIKELVAKFGRPVGLSDHSLGAVLPVMATTLGATVIEKHLTLARADGGPDAAFSSEPHEFADMVKAVKVARAAMNSVAPPDSHKALRRSLYVVSDIQPGETLTLSNVRSIRPSGGLSPEHLQFVLGKRARDFLPRGTPLRMEALCTQS